MIDGAKPPKTGKQHGNRAILWEEQNMVAKRKAAAGAKAPSGPTASATKASVAKAGRSKTAKAKQESAKPEKPEHVGSRAERVKMESPKAETPSPPPADTPSSDFTIRDPEVFARNMARMLEHVGKAAAAWVAPREEKDFVDSAPMTMSEMLGTLSKVSEYWLTDPSRAIEAQTSLFAGYLDVWNQDNIDSSQSAHGAEAPIELAGRLTNAMEKFEQTYEGETILLISHGDSLRYLQLAMAERALTEHLKIKLFGKAEIRRLEDLPDAE